MIIFMRIKSHTYLILNFVCVLGPPLPPEPVLFFNSSSQLKVKWNVPYSHQKYPVESYNIQIVNVSSGDVLESLLNYAETSYVYTIEDYVQYCQILTVNVTAVSAVGQSIPASVSRGFPIGRILLIILVLWYGSLLLSINYAAPQLFQSDVIVILTFPNDRTPMANISFMVCQNNYYYQQW